MPHCVRMSTMVAHINFPSFMFTRQYGFVHNYVFFLIKFQLRVQRCTSSPLLFVLLFLALFFVTNGL